MRSLIYALCALSLALTAGCGSSKKHRTDGGLPDSGTDGATSDAGDGSTPEDGSMSCSAPSLMIVTTEAGSSLRVGWTGLGHGIALPPDASYALEVFDCDDECRACRVSGPVAVPGVAYSQQRCSNDTRVSCSSDEDCDGHACRFYLSAGLEANIGGVSACARVGFSPLEAALPNGSRQDVAPIQGAVDLVTGAVQLDEITLHVEQGLCNYCQNDGTIGDGVRSGTCETGGATCDAQAAAGLSKFLSFDCAPPASLGEFDIDVAPLRTSTVEWTLGNDSPDCGAAGGKKCFCGECNNGHMCHQDADCSSGGCNAIGTTRPNGCDADENPLSVVPTTCTTSDSNHNVGDCRFSIQAPIQFPSLPCYADNGTIGSSVRVFGAPQPFVDSKASLTLASLACLPSADNGGALDNALGVPGLAAVEIKFHANLVYP